MTRDATLSTKIRIVKHSVMLLVGVILMGTLGYAFIEHWPLWDSFFFTIVTITTVGYGDNGLSDAGERFTAALMLVGIGSLTYTVGQIIQATIAFGFDRERNMQRQIASLRNHVIVCGLGRIGMQVCNLLDEAGTGFVAIDRTEASVDAARHRGWIATVGDATDDDTLIAAGIRNARALVSVTSRDSDNIVVTLSARSITPDLKIFSRAEHPDSIRKIRRAGATRVVSPAFLSGQKITDAILRPSLSKLLDPIEDQGHAMRLFEFQITPASTLAGQTIEQINASHDQIVFVALSETDGTVGVRPRSDRIIEPGQTYIVAGCESSIGTFLDEFDQLAA